MKNNRKVDRLREHTRLTPFFSLYMFISFKVILLPYCPISNKSSSGNYCPNKKRSNWQTAEEGL